MPSKHVPNVLLLRGPRAAARDPRTEAEGGGDGELEMPQYDRRWNGRCTGVHFSLPPPPPPTATECLPPPPPRLIWSRDCLFTSSEACKMGRSLGLSVGGGERRSGGKCARALAACRKKKTMTLRPVGPTSERWTSREGERGERGRKIGECLSLSAFSLPLSLSRFLPEISVNVKVKEGS